MTTSTTEQELDAALASYIEKVNTNIGEVTPVPLKRKTHRDYTLNHRYVTEDIIRLFSAANGDTNPLWRDSDYAESSPWGGIVAPPLYIYTAAAVTVFPEPPAVPGFELVLGGNHVEQHLPLRPGDTVTAEDLWNGVEDRSRPGRSHRTLVFHGDRIFYNQNGDKVVTLHAGIVGTVPVPGSDVEKAGPVSREMPRYSEEELAEIYEHYDRELSGELRRGDEPRFFEDVAEGDDLGVCIKGPLDSLDVAAFIGIAGVGIANADKWEMVRTEKDLSPVDPTTGAYHFQMDWHIDDTSAQTAGMPRAINFGAYMEINLMHLVSNWLGDYGWIRDTSVRIGAPMFKGDILRITGSVTRTWEEDGVGLAELSVTAVERTGIKMMTGKVIVELPHRNNPTEVVDRLTGGAQ